MKLIPLASFLALALVARAEDPALPKPDMRVFEAEGFALDVAGLERVEEEKPDAGRRATFVEGDAVIRIYRDAGKPAPAREAAETLEKNMRAASKGCTRERLNFGSAISQDDQFELVATVEEKGGSFTYTIIVIHQPDASWMVSIRCPEASYEDLKPSIDRVRLSFGILDLGRETPERLLDGMVFAMKTGNARLYTSCMDLDAILDSATGGKHSKKTVEEQEQARAMAATMMRGTFADGTMKRRFEGGVTVEVVEADDEEGVGLMTFKEEGLTKKLKLELEKGEFGWRIVRATPVKEKKAAGKH